MFKYYLKMAFGHLRNQKKYSMINIIGLTIGITCFVFISLWISFELNFDKYHANADNIYRLTGRDSAEGSAYIRLPILKLLQEKFPEIINVTRFQSLGKPLIAYQEKKFYEDDFFLVDQSVFDMFSIKLLLGDPLQVLTRPQTVVVSQSYARKYFGDTNLVGEILTINNKTDYEVTGVYADLPANSHFNMNFIGSFNSTEKTGIQSRAFAYLLLPDNYPYHTLEKKIDEFADSFDKDSFNYGHLKGMYLQPLTRIHLHSHIYSEIAENQNVNNIYLFSVIALLILIVSSINYINLTTSQAFNRSKEIIVRKLVGANRRQLITQHLIESLLVTFIALVFSLILVWVLLPSFNAIAGSALTLHNLNFLHTLLIVLGTLLVVGLISGTYPALFVSSLHIVEQVVGRMKKRSIKNLLTKYLVIFQFIVSITLIITTMVILYQLHFIRTKNLGFEKEHLIVVNSNNLQGVEYGTLKEKLQSCSGIVNIAAADAIPGNLRYYAPYAVNNINENINASVFHVDEEFFNIFNINFNDGRQFDNTFSTDISNAIIVNDEFQKKSGLENILGLQLKPTRYGFYVRPGEVVGVVDNFHFESLHKKINPAVFELKYNNATLVNRGDLPFLIMRVQENQVQHALASVEKIMLECTPDYPFEYFFLDDNLDQQYAKEYKVARIFNIFSVLTILLSCLGLFAIVSLKSTQKTKEIGIRKVIGANVSSILLLLNKDFFKWIVAANLISWLIAYYVMSKWLQNFSYRIDLSWWIFMLAGVLSLLAVVVTVSVRSLQTALTNPVNALRYE